MALRKDLVEQLHQLRERLEGGPANEVNRICSVAHGFASCRFVLPNRLCAMSTLNSALNKWYNCLSQFCLFKAEFLSNGCLWEHSWGQSSGCVKMCALPDKKDRIFSHPNIVPRPLTSTHVPMICLWFPFKSFCALVSKYALYWEALADALHSTWQAWYKETM